MWPFRKKPVESQSEADSSRECTVYVRNLMVNVDPNDSVLIAMTLANNVCWLTNTRSPDFPHLLEPQYQALPQHCKVYFSPRVITLEPVEDSRFNHEKVL